MKSLTLMLTSFMNIKGRKIVIVRKGESIANQSGLLCGWINAKLSVTGRVQANSLFPVFQKNLNLFEGIYSSDLQRCKEFADIALGFNGVNGRRLLRLDTRLREINFGKDEGVHYDTLTQIEKDRINDENYKASEGESWREVNSRFVNFITEECQGTSLVFTHGGLLCSFTSPLGLTDVVSPGSVLGVSIDSNDRPSLNFIWQYDKNNIDSQ